MTRRADFPLWFAASFVGAIAVALVLAYLGPVNSAANPRLVAASPLVIHLAPGEQVTVIADAATAPPTASPSVAGPACTTTITGQDVWVNATGLVPGQLYAVWWHVQKPDGTTYDASGNEIPAKADGTWRFVYDLTPGHTEVYVYQKRIVNNVDVAYGDPAAAVAECEYDA